MGRRILRSTNRKATMSLDVTVYKALTQALAAEDIYIQLSQRWTISNRIVAAIDRTPNIAIDLRAERHADA